MKSTFHNAGIGMRLGAAFGLLLVLLCMTGAFATYQASRIYENGTKTIADQWLPAVQTLGDIRAYANGVRRTSLRLAMEPDASARQGQRSQHDDSIAKLEIAMQEYQKLIASPEEMQMYRRIQQAWSEYVTQDARVIELSDGASEAAFAEARAVANGSAGHTFQTALDLITESVRLNSQGAAKAREEAASSYHTALTATAVMMAVAAMIGIGAAVVITRSITVPMRTAVTIAQTVARGDLTSRIDVAGRDETSMLLRALKDMNANLAGLIGRVRAGCESIVTGSAQIATGSADLSTRTEEQAASLEETASSMEQLTATVRQNAESAKQGNALAINASETATRGGVVVGRVVETMQEISDSSAKVSEIIGVIEGIAFQTNILALNAAVEAARAGEQGRGFAVVAAEVRALAQRSASAAKEIKELIDVSVERVNTGAKQVGEAGLTIGEVVRSVQRVTDLMGEIAAASREQHTGIEQVNQAVVQMDQLTQQNAALVEEASAAAQSMSDQALELRDAVAAFRVNASRMHGTQTGTNTASERQPHCTQ
ncbi:methyl-accepting chemotaxis protein [Paraburkholderia nodosa]|uniref:methyl-accepting chemotaxis protein n=1 Tax=Paraburkholderia nodosa TaxID=392320 RepID=UPI0004BCEC96|nr:methyl-accepting chemotaxis protein [Paraburkholderia nodosa]